ncbi:MAG: homogentisate phytyltransferase [Cyanobacteria bacterium]|nr:homogentisate phytyltransferase [Cyanobacteriota bacterium]MDW8200345.1 homogentisate phytyltransferase [Cyanobacteriota bacterium SKYGB_h_bin112]
MSSWHIRFSWLYAFWKFSRPHTVIGTTLSVMALYSIAAAEATTILPIATLPLALFACLCGNIYIVGLNQLEDIGIDRINKPHLPLASGEFSPSQGWSIVGTTGLLALAVAAWQGIWLLATVGISLIIGTAYSLPPIRLKRYALWASWCILTVRGLVVNLGLFLHFQQTLSPGSAAIPPVIWAVTVFMVGFTIAIAIFKDIPDLEGDRQFRINTLTVRLGQRAVFTLAMLLLTTCYLGMILAGLAGLPGVHRPFFVATHALALISLWWCCYRLGISNSPHLNQRYAQLYLIIWSLFFLEYGMIPIAVLLNHSANGTI